MIGWKANVVTSQFKRLKDLNMLQIKESHEVKKKKTIYEIADRLFVIWYQMRYLGVLRRRIEYIVTFLKIWYDLGELKDKISSYASQYQHHYSMGNFSESYGYAKRISIISNAITEVSEKEKIIAVSPDAFVFDGVSKKDETLKYLKEALPDYEKVIINDLTLEEYKKLISREMFTITFGEGYDGYFI